MPLYEYECDACKQRFEVIHQRFSDPNPDACRKCGQGPIRRLMSSPAIQFKGSGFYITDYAQKGKSEGASTKGDGGGGEASKSDGASAGTKSDAAPASTPAKTESSASSTPSSTPAAPASTTKS